MSVDVEDWWNATILQCTGKIIEPFPVVRENVLALLEAFAEAGASATWFFLGEIAVQFPELVRQVVAAGHELGVHGWLHRSIRNQSPQKFRDDLRCAKSVVENAGSAEARGFRAVDFSIGPDCWWALDEIIDAGFTFDSSIFPKSMPRYGWSGAPLGCYWAETERGRRVLEVPVTVATMFGLRIPFAGGGYFRLLPLRWVLGMMRRASSACPVVFYLHPCEIEASSQMETKPSGVTDSEWATIRRQFARETKGRSQGRRKLARLLQMYRFRSIGETIQSSIIPIQVVPPPKRK